MQISRRFSLIRHVTFLDNAHRTFATACQFRAATASKDVVAGVSRTRNIGIIAHIDAVSPNDFVITLHASRLMSQGKNNDYGAYALL